MLCPRCHKPHPRLDEPCPQCNFSGDPAELEELAHVRWLLAELANWASISTDQRQALEKQYQDRRHGLEVKLGLRRPPLAAAEVAPGWEELFRQEALLQRLTGWGSANQLNPTAVLPVLEQTRNQVDELRLRLEGYPRPSYPATDANRLALADFLLQAVSAWPSTYFFTPATQTSICAALQAEKDKLKPPPVPVQPAPVPEPRPVPQPQPVPPPPPPPPAEPPIPWQERMWRTILSERTLQALLFLGIFLLFSAALSFVVWGWKDFSAPVRVAVPTAFTAVFFGLGWLVRTRTHLTRSSLALSAIAALLIPIDFYTLYVNFSISPDLAPLFWLFTSLICLAAYSLITVLIPNLFFGYLTGAAAGSAVLAGIEMSHQAYGLSLDWRSAGLALLALGFTGLAAQLERGQRRAAAPGKAIGVFAVSLRWLGLLGVGVLLPLTFGWRYIGRLTYDTLHTAMTITWWVGGLVLAWGAHYHRSRTLGLLAALALPVAVYMLQAPLLDRAGLSVAWQAVGLAALVPLYFFCGHRWGRHPTDPVLRQHGRTAATLGVILLAVAAVWPLIAPRGSVAAVVSHSLLAGAVVLAALLWQRPLYLYGASVLTAAAVTLGILEWLSFTQLALGWATLALLHIFLALLVRPRWAGQLVVAGYILAGLAVLPPLFPYKNDGLLVYALGNWLGLTAWGARLAHVGQPGFCGPTKTYTALFHWLTALPLPLWVGVLFYFFGPLGSNFALALTVLAWVMLEISFRLDRLNHAYRWPWYLTALAVSVGALFVAGLVEPAGLALAVCVLGAGLLYGLDAIVNRQSLELLASGLVNAWGLVRLLQWLQVGADGLSLALTLLVALYVGLGLLAERRRLPIYTHVFLEPLYWAAHLVGLLVLGRIYSPPFGAWLGDLAWTEAQKLWCAGIQLGLGIVYAGYAWGTYRKGWAYVSIWLVAASGGVIALAYSRGQGSSVAKLALLVMAFILAERGLRWLRSRSGLSRRWRAVLCLVWRLYREPLLVTGWVASAGVIGLALVRNLWMLGGGRVQQIWAVIGLGLITGLYALSARLFRQARFVWLAAGLSFIPWTILTNLGWFTPYRPTLAGFAIGWVALAWLLFLISLWVRRAAPLAFARPLQVVAHMLVPFSLLWTVANAEASRFTVGLAIGFYSLAAWVDYRRARLAPVSILRQTKWLYPAFGLIPLWAVYLLNGWLPAARHEHYGLLLLLLGGAGLAAGRWFRARMAPLGAGATGYALPAYLTSYITLSVGTLLVAHLPSLLAVALLYDALGLVVSAIWFRSPGWVYAAAMLVPGAWLLAVHEAQVPANRMGWWLIGLAALYLMIGWLLRRARLEAYQSPVLLVGFALIALGLPPSSQDKIGAVWGYGGAAVLYALSAFWLRQPLLLTPACALAIVAYAVGLQLSTLRSEYYGLALFPGAVGALALGWGLDRLGVTWRNFPWSQPEQWGQALVRRWLGWWGLPCYCLGFGLASASPFFTAGKPALTAFNFLLLMGVFGWAIYRFRLRGWLLLTALAGHLAVGYGLETLGWWRHPADAWCRFLPATLLTVGVALFIEYWRGEGSPFVPGRLWSGWSRPLYGLVMVDVWAAQLFSLSRTEAAVLISLTHTLLLAGLATWWLERKLVYVGAALGVFAWVQWLLVADYSIQAGIVALSGQALVYGLVGYGLALPFFKRLGAVGQVWAQPLQRFSLVFSAGLFFLVGQFGLAIGAWTIRAMLGYPFRQIVDLPTVQMVVGVLGRLGLLYIAAAFHYRKVRVSYLALGMLLLAWMLHAFYVQQWDGLARVQWYALPAGLYLLGISFLEWRRGQRTLARWLDYAAIVLLMGSLFWQTLLYGWLYALLLGAEGFATFWWGSARRLRRFFYAGLLGVVLATVAQLLNSLQSINQWIVFGLVGLLVIVVGVLVERKREEIKAWLVVLETWE